MHISKYYDPNVQCTLYGRRIFLPFSHSLPILLKNHSFYAANLTRLAEFVRSQSGLLKMIDVGANVGDSYCLADPRAGDSFLLIEGEERFFALLTSNTRHDPSVERELVLLADEESDAEDVLVAKEGNASLQRGSGGSAKTAVLRTTLDRVLETRRSFRNSNLLKVDVEGYDAKVLRGGRKFLKRAKPVVFFEYHPRKLAALGEDDVRIFEEMEGLDYRSCIVYDNLGYLLGFFPAGSPDAWRDLAWYGRSKGIYFDICCFHRNYRTLEKRFLAKEREFFQTRS